MKTYNAGETVILKGKKVTILQVFPGDDIYTYEVRWSDGHTSIEAIV